MSGATSDVNGRPATIVCRLVGWALVCAAALGPAFASAELPLRILVPVPAGGTSDVVARVLADRLRVDLGRPVIVENRPGATGRIAVDALKGSASDGSTLLLAPMVVPVLGPLVFRNVGYDASRDLAPVAQVTTYELALAVAADHPARNLAEFVTWARQSTARVAFGTGGAGSLPHLIGILFGQGAKVELLHVPYKGVNQVASDMIGGQIAAGLSALSDFLPLHRSGRVRILATSGRLRSRSLPEVPTFGEQGFAPSHALGWHGMYAPPGTSSPGIRTLSTALSKALDAHEVRAKLLALGLEPTGTTPEGLVRITEADIAYWRPIVKAAGVSVD